MRQYVPLQSRSIGRFRFRSLAVIALFAISGASGRAQFTYTEDFKNSTAPGWVLNPAGNSTPNVTLTSGATPRSGDPETGGTIDPSGAGWLRLTNTTGNLSNAVYFDTPIPSTGNVVNITFGANLWAGNNFNGTGADGLTFFLYDASKDFQVGANGGSLGYAQKTGVNGLNGGYVAVSLDAYGNFSVAGEGRVGGTGSLQPNSVSVRGPGQGLTGYNYLAGTGNRDYTDTGSPTVLDAGDGTVPALPYTMAFPTATARPNQSTQYRNVSITIDESSQLLVSMQFGEDGLWYNLLNVDLSSFVRPEQLKMGFSAGTGGGTIVSEVGGLLTINATAGSGNFVWDNRNGPGDSGGGNGVWGTSATDPLNWAGQTNPTLKSNVIFNSYYVSSNQTIDITGSDKVLTNLYFSGPKSYTINTSEARKLIFDSTTPGGLTAINLTNDAGGNAAHTINADVQMNQNLDVNNNIDPTLTISGNIDNGGNVLSLKGSGTTVLAGAMSGSGSLLKADSGTAVLNGSSPNTYTGGTSVNGGTLRLEKATALGATSGAVAVASGATLALGGSGTTFAANALTINGDGVGNAGALRNAAGNNTWTGGVALGATGSNSIGVDAATALTVSGNITGAAGKNLTKVGPGTLTLSGTNTYLGSSTINAGTVKVGADTNLGTAPGSATPGHLALNGGTLQTTSTFSLASNRGVALGAAGGTIDTDAATTLTYNGVIAGTSGGALNKAGAGTLALGGVSTYDGATNINAGTVRLGTNNALPAATGVSIAAGATLDANSFSAQVGSLAGAGNVSLGNTGSTSFTTGGNNQSTTLSGVISGGTNNALTKTGTGDFTLTGVNTLSGNVTVNNGGLILNAAGGALGNAANITVATGGTLSLGASNQINDSANLILAGGTFATGGFNETMRQLSQTASSTLDYLNDGSILNFNGGGSVAGLGTVTGTMSITNWAGSISGGGGEQLIVYGPSGAPDVSNLTFTDWGAATTVARTDLGTNIFEIVPLAVGVKWNVDSGSVQNWAVNNNWSPNSAFPNATNAIAILGDTVGSPPLNNDITISMQTTNRTVGKLIFENSANKSYTIGNGTSGRLDFNVSSGQAQIIVNDNGAHTIAASSRVNDALLVTNNSNAATGLTLAGGLQFRTNSSTMTFNGAGTTEVSGTITQSGVTGSLLKAGSGTLVLSSSANSYTGNTTVSGGTLQLNADAPSGANGALGNSSAAIMINDANTPGTMNTALVVGASGVSVGRAITVGSQGATTTIGGATSLTSGTATYNNTVTYNKAVDLNASGASIITFSGTLTDGAGGSGTSALTKTGTGTVVLAGGSANIGNGNVTVGAGTLEIAKTVANGAIGDNAAVNIAGGATLRFNAGQSETIGSLLGAGTVDNINAGAMTLTTGGNNANTTFSGIIQDTGGDLSLTKNGTGTLVLANANTYAGATTIAGGTLTAQNISALGNAGVSTTTSVTNGATLALDLIGTNTITNESLTLNGAGYGGTGALRNLGGNNTWTGGITLGSAATLRSDAGSLTVGTGNISGTGLGLTIDGSGNTTIASSLATGTAGTLTKDGTGTLTLSNANTYTGATNINAGVVEIQNATALGTAATGTTVANGATLQLAGGSYTTAEGLTVGGQGVGLTGAIRNTSADHTLTGNIALTAETLIGVASGTTLTASGAISGTGFGLSKIDNGTLVLSGANSYSGTTAINAGTLQITGAGTLGTTATPTTISIGATLALNNLSGTTAENITATGLGVGGVGAIQNVAGTNTVSGNISLTGNTRIGVTAGSLITSGNISGAYDLQKTGPGGLTLSGTASSYTGTTTILNGNLTVTANAPVSANGALGSSGSAVQVGATGTATSDNLGLLIGNATGGVSIDRAISVNNLNTSGTTTLGGTNTSGANTFSGSVGLGRDVTLTAAAGGTVAFTGILSDTGGITKTGGGVVTLSGNNTFSGATSVTAGTLVATSNNALGSTAATTAVTSGATLGLQGNITLPAGESLALAGPGASSVGALNSISGNNTVSGAIALTGPTTMGSASAGSTLTLAGAVSGAQNLATTGAGNFVFGAANTNSGTLTLGGSAGSITSLGAAASFGNITSLTINSGNTFALGANNQINNSANLILAGGTLNVGSFDATMNQLSQTSASTIDYLNDGSVLRFNSTGGLGTLTGSLTIANWAGSLSGSGTEQLVIYSPSAPNVANFSFDGWGSGAATYISRGDLGAGYYEILPLVTAVDWNVNGNGTWGTGTNWVGNSAPNAIGAIARLGNLGSAAPLTANPTISVQAATTVGTLIFDNSSGRNYTVNSTNGSVLTLDASSGAATVNVNDNGSHTIAVNSQFKEGLTITNSSTATTGLTISGNVAQTVAGTQTLTATGSGHTLISGVVSNPTGTTNLLKTGAGTLTLSGANTFTGTTTVRNGVLEVNNNSALGSTTSTVVINDASTTGAMDTALYLGASGVTLSRNLTVGSQGATTTLGGDFASGTSTFSGTVTLNKSATLAAAGTSVVNFNGQLIDGTGTTNVTKTGTGTVVLGSTANNYDGATDITAGTLRLGTANVVPNGSAVSVTTGATFDLNGFSETIGSLAGAGNVTGTAGTNTLTTGGNNASTTFSGVISDAAGTLSLVKTGTGTMTLSGTNTYDGATTVSSGTLIAANNTALGTAAGATSVTAGATLGLQGGITVTGEAMTLNTNSGSPSTAALSNLAGTNVSTGAVTLVAASANDAVKIDAAGGSQLTLSGSIGQGANAAVLSKTGTGTLILSGANTYTGSTNVAAGTLIVANNAALGTTAAGTAVQIGATLGVQNNVSVAAGEAFNLYGTIAPPSAPSIKNISGTNTLAGAVTLNGGTNTGVAIDANSGSLTLNGAITQASNPNYVIKTGAGDLTLGGASGNTFTGGFTINDGKVIAAKTSGDATGASNVNIGDGIGAAASATLQLNASNQINNSSAVTIQTDGRLDVQSYNDTIGALTMGGGNVQGTGTLTLGNNLTFNGVGSSTAAISANLDLGTTGTRVVQVGNNGNASDTDLTISGAISGGTGSFNKTDLGTLQLTGTTANTFSGTFQVSDGTVTLNKTAGVNATGTGSLSVGDGSGAANTAKLTLLASDQINDTSRVTVYGDGKFAVGAGLTETIGSFAGAGTIDVGAGAKLTAGGDNSSTTFSGTLAGTGEIVKTGTGTLTFDQNLNFAGTLTLNGGTLALGTTGAGINLTVGTLYITGNTILDFGNSASSILNATNVIIAPGATLSITNWVNLQDYFYANGNFQQFGGPVAAFDTRGTAPQNQVVFSGWGGNSTAWQSWDRQITPAPEPATYGAMMVGGALAMLGYRRWRKRTATTPSA